MSEKNEQTGQRSLNPLRRGVVFLWLLLVLALPALARPSLITQPWPEADALFHQDPRWLGGDDAYSLDLGGGRVLWLFGDSFVAPPGAVAPPGGQGGRNEACVVRNTLAIQSGYDPSRAKMKFCWREDPSGPASFFPERGDCWYWPGHAVLVEGKLLIFLMKIAPSSGPLGFQAVGWDAVLIDNPAEDPSRWHLRDLVTPKNALGVVVGSGAVLREGPPPPRGGGGDFIYAYGTQESPQHDVYLVRWSVAEICQGDLSRPQWWDGAGWTGQAKALWTQGQTEFTVHRDERLGRFIEIQTEGFGDAQLVYREAPTPSGPWSQPISFFHPPDGSDPELFVYAGKCHPQLKGADWIVTYVSNSFHWARLLADPHIYFPRFLRVNLVK